MKRVFKVIAVIILSVFLFLITFLAVFPVNMLKTWLIDGIEKKTGIILSIEDFQKGFPFYVEAKNINIISDEGGGTVFYIDRLKVRLDILSLIYGKVRVFVDGSAKDGKIDGEAVFKIKNTALDIKTENMSIPYLTRMGIDGGVFDGRWQIVFNKDGCPAGTISLEGRDIAAKRISIMDAPFGAIERTRINMELLGDPASHPPGCKLKVRELWIDGKDVSAVAQGEISLVSPFKNSRIDIALEIIPRVSLIENKFILNLIKNYRKSANYYLINIKGTVEAPVLE
jgi:type II secretion system protein N